MLFAQITEYFNLFPKVVELGNYARRRKSLVRRQEEMTYGAHARYLLRSTLCACLSVLACSRIEEEEKEAEAKAVEDLLFSASKAAAFALRSFVRSTASTSASLRARDAKERKKERPEEKKKKKKKKKETNERTKEERKPLTFWLRRLRPSSRKKEKRRRKAENRTFPSH